MRNRNRAGIWEGRHYLALMLGLALVAVMTACNPPTAPTPPTVINVCGGSGGCGNQNGNPTPSPSPGAPGTGTCAGADIIDSIRVNPFGFTVPAGTDRPANSAGILPVGVTAHVTATPKDKNGADVPANLHGSAIAWEIVSGAQYIQVTADAVEAFNRNTLGVSAPGEFVLKATVCGKSGAWVARTVPAGARTLGPLEQASLWLARARYGIPLNGWPE